MITTSFIWRLLCSGLHNFAYWWLWKHTLVAIQRILSFWGLICRCKRLRNNVYLIGCNAQAFQIMFVYGGWYKMKIEHVDTKVKIWYNKYMNITKAQYARIEKYFPVQRGNVKIDNYTFINAILYIAENGCKWRALPEKYGKWNSIYQRFKRWCENGVIQRIFNALQREKIIAIKVEVLALDSTSCKLHPDAHGALKNTDNNVSGNQRADGIPSFTWYPQMTRSLSKCTYPVETVTTPHKEESQLKT